MSEYDDTTETNDSGNSSYRRETVKDSGKPLLMFFSTIAFAVAGIAAVRMLNAPNQNEIAQLKAQNEALQVQVQSLNNNVYQLSERLNNYQPYVRVNVEAGARP